MGKIITFGTLKGGVGKTMLCFNIGGILSQLGYRVLVIDSDLQGNLTNNMGIDRTQPDLLTTYDVYNLEEAQPEPDQLVIKSPIDRLPLLDMIAGSIFLHKSELKIASVAGREQILSNYLSDHKAFFDQYDYILIDTNPSMSIVNQNAFLASDAILLVSDVSMNAIEGAQLFIALWEEARKRLRREDNIKGFIVNDFDSRNKLSNTCAPRPTPRTCAPSSSRRSSRATSASPRASWPPCRSRSTTCAPRAATRSRPLSTKCSRAACYNRPCTRSSIRAYISE